MLGVTLQIDTGPISPTTELSSVPEFVGSVFPTLVAIIAAAAVLAIAFWGVRYMLSNVAGIKGVSKNRIWDALFGLLIALSAYLILKTINPDILNSLNNLVSNSK